MVNSGLKGLGRGVSFYNVTIFRCLLKTYRPYWLIGHFNENIIYFKLSVCMTDVIAAITLSL